MPTSASPFRSRFQLILRSTLIALVLSALGWTAYAQIQSAARVPFTRMRVRPAALHFKRLNFLKGTPSFQTRDFMVINTGKDPINPLTVNVGQPTGTGAASFMMTAPPNPIVLAAGASAIISVTFVPTTDGRSVATIPITSDATRGRQTRERPIDGFREGTNLGNPDSHPNRNRNRDSHADPYRHAVAQWERYPGRPRPRHYRPQFR